MVKLRTTLESTKSTLMLGEHVLLLVSQIGFCRHFPRIMGGITTTGGYDRKSLGSRFLNSSTTDSSPSRNPYAALFP
jgi:hypothetical protein